MSAVISHLRETWHGVHAIITEITRASAEFKAIMKRITSPEMPPSDPTISFWQVDPHHPKLVDIRSENLPETADIVIIGSGISGASIAYTMLSECASLGITKRVVILEARETCSGATGRNGGHIKCAPYATYSSMKARFGIESAKKILRFQQRHLPIILDLASAEGLEDSEAIEVETVDMFTDSSAWENAKRMVRELRQDVPEAALDLIVWDSEDARKVLAPLDLPPLVLIVC
jgi:glycine/D-amino acid oxidase-like deaminating enzyme